MSVWCVCVCERKSELCVLCVCVWCEKERRVCDGESECVFVCVCVCVRRERVCESVLCVVCVFVCVCV